MWMTTDMSVPAERTFVILRYKGKIPAIASCAKCQRKFFTPDTFSYDPVGAKKYLLNRFDRHECEEELRGFTRGER